MTTGRAIHHALSGVGILVLLAGVVLVLGKLQGCT